jgi:PIN domain nuclease of toxin-antitoxin system
MAGYLIDSNAFIWFKTGSSKLSAQALAAIESGQNQVYLSLASIWEMGIKVAQGKLSDFADLFARGSADVERALQDSNIDMLVPGLVHVLQATALPRHHLDPFDRVIIAQAQIGGLIVVTSDRIFARYGVPILPAQSLL